MNVVVAIAIRNVGRPDAGLHAQDDPHAQHQINAVQRDHQNIAQDSGPARGGCGTAASRAEVRCGPVPGRWAPDRPKRRPPETCRKCRGMSRCRRRLRAPCGPRSGFPGFGGQIAIPWPWRPRQCRSCSTNRKNRIMRVDRPNRTQKILRASASRKVSRIRARVSIVYCFSTVRTNTSSSVLVVGASDSISQCSRAQQIHRCVHQLAAGKLEVDQAVAHGHRGRLDAQFLRQGLARMGHG